MFIQRTKIDVINYIFKIELSDTSDEPEKVVLDPNMWVLMDADFRKVE